MSIILTIVHKDAKTKPKILCLDDEDGVLQALHRVLRDDFQVLIAHNATEGLKLLTQNNDVAVILSDYRMPGQNGIDFLRQAKVVSPLAVRSILSGQMDLRQMAEALNGAEIHRFILKPWENDYLRVQMLEALQTHVLMASREQFRSLSVTDPVTGLANHRYFQDVLKRVCEDQSPVSLLMMDVDHFKSFNDRYGHPQGDRLLFEIAQILKQSLGPGQVACRYGGEEFAAILPGTRLADAHQVGETIRTNLEHHPFKSPIGARAYVTISIGVASFPDQATDPKTLIEHADYALLDAKRRGRNQTVSAS